MAASVLGDVASAVLKNAVGGSTGGQDANGQPVQGSGEGVLKQSAHPTTLLFHVGFKLAALFVYLFGGWVSSSFVFSFVLVVLLLAFDFWTVKNVSGRLLVGLRWWNEVREDGTNEWRFESREDTSRIADVDSRVFWLTLWVWPLLWGFFTIQTFFSFNYGWMLCTLVALALSGANLYGYMKCSRAAKDRVSNIASSVASNMFQQGLASQFGGGGSQPAAGGANNV
mmetsp:Transcript_54542/g.111271  ORF Transcript_54542/g.111271 Transcript_54542/m.111271 type:complete len:226 (+) Transcript_54542:102-779(+)|eukprot:CAMPEP_0181311472 /NCGR_PEP_ID=MMETSP1101-20121128/13155_1 /TAXON_ID=46948 /ORGANISM="Rhodomonas abbreviata, Strain Caron Lab Isolate" /LENGTH=225 /DNA_ID=CAMNT_0023418205 /DNA_START=102 /DNA_END=779 /DNA_ORIENTATION=-